MSEDDDFGEVFANLYFDAYRAAAKMKTVYDELHPDAGPNECWAEVESLHATLERIEEKTGYGVRQT